MTKKNGKKGGALLTAIALMVAGTSCHVKSPDEYSVEKTTEAPELESTEVEPTEENSTSTLEESTEEISEETTTKVVVVEVIPETTAVAQETTVATVTIATTTTVQEKVIEQIANQVTEPAKTAETAIATTTTTTVNVVTEPVTEPAPVPIEYPTEDLEQYQSYEGTETYVVQPGDSVYGIAEKFEMSPDRLVDINGISGYFIYPGMTLFVENNSGYVGYEEEPIFEQPEYVQEYTGEWLVKGNYTSLYNPNVTAASWDNIQLASAILNAGGWWNYSNGQYTAGLRIGPGEYFSWLSIIGPCDGYQGFVEAGSYALDDWGNTVPSSAVGGGVCFPCTALMQAARSAGCVITEKHDHSAPVSYASPGDEASFNAGSWDLQFYNPSKSTALVFYMDTSCWGYCNVTVTVG